MSVKEYEFTEEQNQDLDQLYKRLNMFTLVLMISGAGILVGAIKSLIGTAGMLSLPLFGFSIAMTLMGVYFRKPLINIKNIIETEGQDITELMIAIKDFSRAFLSGAILSLLFFFVVIWRVQQLF